MSAEQAKTFTEGLQTLTDEFKKYCATTTEIYIEDIEGMAAKFQKTCHTYAKNMTAKAAQYTEDIQALYNEVYPEEG